MTARRFITMAALSVAVTTVAGAQATTKQDTAHRTASKAHKGGRKHAAKKEDLQSQAKIAKADAEKTALSKVAAGSTIKSSELEREKGTIVYSFDIKVPGQPGVEEIIVSAIDGSVVSQKHESAAAEKAEARKERMEKKAAKKGQAKNPEMKKG